MLVICFVCLGHRDNTPLLMCLVSIEPLFSFSFLFFSFLFSSF